MTCSLQSSTTRSTSTAAPVRTDQTPSAQPAGQDTAWAGHRSATASTEARKDSIRSIIDPLVPSWEPARGMGRTTVFLAELLLCLVLLVLIANILHRTGYFLFEFLGRGKWREAPRDLKISLGKEGVIVETLQKGQVAKAPFQEKLISDLAARVDNLEGGVNTLGQTVNGLIKVETEQALQVAAGPDTPHAGDATQEEEIQDDQ